MRFKALLYLKTKEEGGRHSPIFSGYKPKFVTNGRESSCTVILLESAGMMMPGSRGQVEIEIEETNLKGGALFELAEGTHIVASGSII